MSEGSTNAIEGYVFVPDSDPGIFAGVHAGLTVRKPDRTPPWIVVDHSLESTIVGRWPGKLWRVAVVDARRIDQASLTAHYTRACAVRIIEEVPAWRLFGQHGQAVAAMVSMAFRLDAATAEQLAAHHRSEADEAYARAFERWYDSTGAVHAPQIVSPVNGGFSLISRLVWNQAERAVGHDAFVDVEVHGETERELASPWAEAQSALCNAAMALGAPSLAAQDADVLSHAWRMVTDADESTPSTV